MLVVSGCSEVSDQRGKVLLVLKADFLDGRY